MRKKEHKREVKLSKQIDGNINREKENTVRKNSQKLFFYFGKILIRKTKDNSKHVRQLC